MVSLHQIQFALIGIVLIGITRPAECTAEARYWTNEQTQQRVLAELDRVDLETRTVYFLISTGEQKHASLGVLSQVDLDYIRINGAAENQLVSMLQSTSTAQISGIVFDRDRDPTAGVVVRAVSQLNPDDVVARVITGADGSYKLDIPLDDRVSIDQLRLDFIPPEGMVPGTDEQLKSDRVQTINKVLDGVPNSKPAREAAVADPPANVENAQDSVERSVQAQAIAGAAPAMSESAARQELKQIFDNLQTMEEFLQRTELKDKFGEDDIALRDRILQYLESVQDLPGIQPGTGRIYDSVKSKIDYLRTEYDLDQPAMAASQVCTTRTVCQPACRPVCRTVKPRRCGLFRRWSN